jgi:predicted tellurium resistance membrane protein TerC
MERYPATVYLGGAILGRVGGEMILTDPFIVGILHPTDTLRYVVEGVLIVAVLAAGKLLGKKRA